MTKYLLSLILVLFAATAFAGDGGVKPVGQPRHIGLATPQLDWSSAPEDFDFPRAAADQRRPAKMAPNACDTTCYADTYCNGNYFCMVGGGGNPHANGCRANLYCDQCSNCNV